MGAASQEECWAVDLAQFVTQGTVRSPRRGVLTGRLILQDDRRVTYRIYGGNVPFIKQNSLTFEGLRQELDEETSLDIEPRQDGTFQWANLTREAGLELYWEGPDGDVALVVPPQLIDWTKWTAGMIYEANYRKRANQLLIESRPYYKRRVVQQRIQEQNPQPKTGLVETVVGLGSAAAATATAAMLLLLSRR